MEASQKLLYEQPLMVLIEVKSEGIVCASGGTENYNNNNPVSW